MTVQQHYASLNNGKPHNSNVKRALCIAETDTISMVNDTVELLGWRLDHVETVEQAVNSLKFDDYEAIITAVSTDQATLFDESKFDEKTSQMQYNSRLLQQAIKSSPETFRIVYSYEAVEFLEIREACFENGADTAINSPECLFSALFAFMTPPDDHRPGQLSPKREEQLLEIAGGFVTKRLQKMVARQASGSQNRHESIPPDVLIRPTGTSNNDTTTSKDAPREVTREDPRDLEFLAYKSEVHQCSGTGISVRVVHVSDTVGNHRGLVLPEGDIFLHAGNFTDGRTSTCLEQLEDFLVWIQEEVLPKFRQVAFVAGSQDFFLDLIACKYNAASREAQKIINRFLSKHQCVAFLENTSIEYRGLKIYGSSTTLMKVPSNKPVTGDSTISAFERNVENFVGSDVDDDCDILLTHRPPSHIFAQAHYELPTDRLYNSQQQQQYGAEEADERKKRSSLFGRKKDKPPPDMKIKRPPRLHAFGHYSRDFGIEDHAGTLLLNGSQERVFREDKYGGGIPLVVDLPLYR